MSSIFIYFIKKDIFFLKKYLLELYFDFFNSKFLKKKYSFLKKKILLIKFILNLKKKNENFIR